MRLVVPEFGQLGIRDCPWTVAEKGRSRKGYSLHLSQIVVMIWKDGIVSFPRLVHKVRFITLFLSLDSSFAEQIMGEFEVTGILSHCMKTKQRELELRMTGVPMHLVRVRTECLHKQLEVL